ncbi:DUF2017 family protein [Jatrophihabitans fulvus]
MRLREKPLRLELGPGENKLLDGLLDELGQLLEADDPDDAARQRLFPSAYPDDADAEAEYRSITETGLRDDRLARIEECAADLADGSATIALADEAAVRRWIQVLNDLRLALGTRLGVTEEPPEIDPDDPAMHPWAVYHWLTAVQDTVVNAVMP